MFESLRSKEPVGYGISYYGTAHGDILPLSNENFVENQVIRSGFIIGILRFDALRPIYDEHFRMVIVRVRDSANIPLSAYEAQIIPYNQGSRSRGRDIGFQRIGHSNVASNQYIHNLRGRNP